MRSVQDTEYVVNNSIYQQQIEKAETRINNLAHRVSRLHLMNEAKNNTVIHTIDLDIKDYQNSKQNVLEICNFSYNSKLVKFLSIEPDEEEDGSTPVLIKFDGDELVMNYRKSSIQIKSVFNIIPKSDSWWMIIVDYNHIKNELVELKNATISFDVNENKFYLKIAHKSHYKTIVLNRIRENPVSYLSDIDRFTTSNQYFEFSKDIFEKLSLAEILIESNAVHKHLCWTIFTTSDTIHFYHFSPITIYKYAVKMRNIREINNNASVTIHKNIIDIILSFDFSNIRIEAEREYKRALIILDKNIYFIIEHFNWESEKYYDFSSRYFWDRFNHYPLLNKNIFKAKIENILAAGSKYINLEFNEYEISINTLDKLEINNVSIKCNNPSIGSYHISTKLILKLLKYFKNDSMCLGLVESCTYNLDFPSLFVMGYSSCTESQDSIHFWRVSLGVAELSDDFPDSVEFMAEDEIPTELKPIYRKIREAKNSDGYGLILEAIQESPDQRFCQLQGKQITPER